MENKSQVSSASAVNKETEHLVQGPKSHVSNGTAQPQVASGSKSRLLVGQPKVALAKYLFAVFVAFAGWGARVGWQALLDTDFHDQFFFGQVEYLMMHNMSRWAKTALVHSPFLAPDARANLEPDLSGHVAHIERYDPKKHDRVYRSLEKDLLAPVECARIRAVIERNNLSKGRFLGEAEDSTLNLEFREMSVLELLQQGVDGDDSDDDDDRVSVTEEEKALLRDVLGRVQRTVEKTFSSSTMINELAVVTRRRNPVPEGWSYALRRLFYRTTGGHGMHSDQCATSNDPKVWSTGFTCELAEFHCCAYRTHSALLYLNDPDDDLVGGELYLVDRRDLLNESVPSYSGVNMASQLRHTVRVEPRCGNLMMFASDGRNYHGTLPIQRGSRYAMPMWFTDPENLPRHRNKVLTSHLRRFWDRLYENCDFMELETGIPVPSGLKQYVGDCDSMVKAVKELVYHRLLQ